MKHKRRIRNKWFVELVLGKSKRNLNTMNPKSLSIRVNRVINSLYTLFIFLFVGGDTLTTYWFVKTGLGRETNPILNFVIPDWTLLIAIKCAMSMVLFLIVEKIISSEVKCRFLIFINTALWWVVIHNYNIIGGIKWN